MSRAWSLERLGSFWDRPDVERWKDNSRTFQTQCYHGYRKKQYSAIRCSKDGNLEILMGKICFARFGMPSLAPAGSLLGGYTSAQQHEASALVDIICGEYPKKAKARVEWMTLFVCCKSDDGESTEPVFRIRIDGKTVKFVDASGSVYASWHDWLMNNTLPKMKYCYPRGGVYSCVDGGYHPDKAPVLRFGNSPSNLTSTMSVTKTKLSTISSFFSISVRPTTAIRRCAEYRYVINYRNSMSPSEEGRRSFDRYLCQNKGHGPIENFSNIVKLLKKIKNPDHLFNGISNADKISIDLTNGENIVLSIDGTEQMPTSVPVNRTLFAAGPNLCPALFQVCVALKNHSDFVTNDLKINEMKPFEAQQLETALLDEDKNCNEDMITTAVSLAVEMQIKSIGEFCALLGILKLHAGKMSQWENKLSQLQPNSPGRNDFLNGIRDDVARVKSIASGAAITFASDLNAVCHCRKHAKKFGFDSANTSENFRNYLVKLPEDFFKPENLRNVEIRRGIICETYSTPLSSKALNTRDNFGRLLKIPGNKKPIMITIHKDKRQIINYNADLEKIKFSAPHLRTLVSQCS